MLDYLPIWFLESVGSHQLCLTVLVFSVLSLRSHSVTLLILNLINFLLYITDLPTITINLNNLLYIDLLIDLNIAIIILFVLDYPSRSLQYIAIAIF